MSKIKIRSSKYGTRTPTTVGEAQLMNTTCGECEVSISWVATNDPTEYVWLGQCGCDEDFSHQWRAKAVSYSVAKR